MSLKKILAATLAAVLALSMAACGAKEEAETTAPAADDTTIAAEAETFTEAVEITEESTDAAEEATEAATEAQAETEAAAEVTEAATEAETEAEKKVPTTKEEIVEFYKNAATETDKGTVKTNSKMKLEALDGGGGAIGAFVNVFKPAVESALEKNSTPSDHITGGYKNLTADDVASATAVDDGKYTEVTINLKEQTDGFTADSKSGHVGHGVTVLGNVQSAIDEINGLSAEVGDGTVQLRYNGAYIKAKIDNETGKIVSGTWFYRVNILIDNVKMKLGIFTVTPKNMTGVVSNTVTM